MYVNIIMMVMTKNTSYYLQCLDITIEDNYNGTCMPLFNFVIAQKNIRTYAQWTSKGMFEHSQLSSR